MQQFGYAVCPMSQLCGCKGRSVRERYLFVGDAQQKAVVEGQTCPNALELPHKVISLGALSATSASAGDHPWHML